MTPTPTHKRVLIADDDEDMRELLHMVLRSADYTVVGAAADGDEALELWRRERAEGVCAVILDQRMPGRYGIDVATEIRAEDPDQAVILLSAFIDPAVERQAQTVGIVACIPKQDVLGVPNHEALVRACAN